jgi:RNA polymerase sigma-B factor
VHAEDVLQVASIGLLKAIDRYDPDRGIAFTSFATPTILGEIKRYFRDKSWAVRVPRELQELSMKVGRATEELESHLGRPPTAAELAGRVGSSIEDVLEARVAATARYGVSLDRPSGSDEDGETTIGARFAVNDHELARVEDDVTVQRLMAHLDDREREILRLRFQEDMTQAEIGERLGVSQMHVSRLIRRSIATLSALAGTTTPN